ncbi:MAG: mandelate racemase [Verrucomicrobia bacterium]|nr:mandelate racemase [Verrucomicrobiota bacterium]MBT5477897.1 mandelate racemase [Verrucomicrobiota bacterium]MBT6238674.1 mandelate racemase [Verrucomicrobiota bacterium]MBT6805633.1 mandelate racemase [Verrucomicrobiota bacterium]MBT7536417.1 mandelate racemase [Verrucomicrobiota bacterium]
MPHVITKILADDRRFELPDGAGSDAVHSDPQYGYAVTQLITEDENQSGTGIAYTLGGGTHLVQSAIELLSEPLVGQEIEALMSDFGTVQRAMAEHHQIRWLGPHKGVTHLALASITNACFDLWAKARGVPLWKLLLDLSPEALARLIDFSYLDEVLTADEAVSILKEKAATRSQREHILKEGYPGYDTSVGWFAYSDERIMENARHAIDLGFTAMKLKVGSPQPERDVRRVQKIREAVGEDVRIMVDANQAWSLPKALEVCQQLASMQPYWVEEPTQPDDILAHQTIARAIAPVPVAVGEAVSNRVMWKNFLQAGAVGVVQADCTRLAGISEYLAVSLLATKYPVKVIPHVGDMGQIHHHLVFFNHIALGHEKLFLEYIPHLREHFMHPAIVKDGAYQLPQEPGCSTDLLPRGKH